MHACYFCDYKSNKLFNVRRHMVRNHPEMSLPSPSYQPSLPPPQTYQHALPNPILPPPSKKAREAELSSPAPFLHVIPSPAYQARNAYNPGGVLLKNIYQTNEYMHKSKTKCR